MADLGTSLRGGIALGEARRPQASDMNLERIIASLPGTRGMTQRRASPATIRSNAADLALRERALDLQERQVAIQEKNQEMIRTQALETQRRQYGIDQAAREDRARARTYAAEDRATAAEEKAYQTGMAGVAYGKAERGQSQQEDYQMAKAAIGSGQAGPVLEYFEKWGNPKMQIQDIQFGQGPHEPVQVTFSNAPDKPAQFQDAGQAFAMLLAPTSPQVASAKDQFKEREVAAKERDVDIKEEKGKTLTAKEKAELNRKIAADVDKAMTYGAGRPEQYATDEEWRAALLDQKRQEVLGVSLAAGGQPQPPEQPAEQGPGYQEVRVRNRETGEIGVKRTFPDGSTEIYDAKGSMIKRAWGVGEKTPRTYEPPGGEKSTRGEVHTLPITGREPPARTQAIPTEQETTEKGKPAVAYHTDAEGNKVASWVNERGEVETRVVEKKKDKDKDKKKKKEGVHD